MKTTIGKLKKKIVSNNDGNRKNWLIDISTQQQIIKTIIFFIFIAHIEFTKFGHIFFNIFACFHLYGIRDFQNADIVTIF